MTGRAYKQILDSKRQMILHAVPEPYGLITTISLANDLKVQGYTESDRTVGGMKIYAVPDGALQKDCSFIIMKDRKCRDAVRHFEKIYRRGR